MKQIITIQHTQSVHHTNGMVGSWTDWDLSKLGIEQANKIGENLKKLVNGKQFVMYSSDLLRARHTAQIVGSYLGVTPVLQPELRERNLGKCVGKSVQWLKENLEMQERTIDDRLFSDAESRRDEWNRLAPFFDMIMENEDRLDAFTDAADNYLIQLSANIDNETDNRHRNMSMQSIRDIERIGDYATNLDEMAMKYHNSDYRFSENAKKEISILESAVQEILRITIEALGSDDDYIARRIEPLEEVIDDMVLLLKDRHTDRLCKGCCSIDSGLIFMDILTYFERVADQCSSIAMLILSKNNAEIMKNHHTYLEELHTSGDQSYLAEQENRKEQYLVPLQNIGM